MKLLVSLAVATAILVGPAAATADQTATYEPTSGPPGTVVHISNITVCEPPQVAGQIAFAPTIESIHTPPGVFTPPDAEITVPDVADGDYIIGLLCGPNSEALPFTVVSSSAPSFTG